MKYILYIVLFSNVLLLSQTSKKEMLERIKSRGDVIVTEEGNDIYRFEYAGGKVVYKYLGDAKEEDTSHIPTTVIDTWNVDTTLYEDMYTYWQEVPVSTSPTYQLVIADANRNNYPEIYGYSKDFGEPIVLGLPLEIFEMDSSGSFASKYKYPDSVVNVYGVYDVAGNNELKLLTRTNTTNDNLFFKQDSPDSFPTTLDFIFNLYPGQLDDPKFGDFDKNGISDLLFYKLSTGNTVICEYDELVNNFNTIAEFNFNSGYTSGYAFGDFDNDNKTDIIYGSIWGEVFVIEAEKEHTYNLVWEGNLTGYNSYMQMFTNDINKNGKPEFWVSSTTNNGLIDILRFTCFEFTGDNEYEEVYRIDFINVFPIYAYNCFPLDVDKDGIEELVICFDEHIFILKYNDSQDNNKFEIFYMQRNNIPGGFFGVTMYDLDNDGYEELLIHRDIVINNDSRNFTQIFKPNFITSVSPKNENIVTEYSLEQNYPNPFNPVTTISYNLPKRSYISLNVFDILGNEIAILDEGEREEGNHSVQWNGKDKFQNNVSSGIYFIHLETPEYKKTIKGVLLK